MILYITLSILFILLTLVIVFFSWAHFLPSDIDKIIKEVQEEALPEMIKGATGTVKNGEVEIAYEFIECGQKDAETILLVMGHSGGMLRWPEHFIQPLLDANYNLVRYDNRGLGRSSWMKNWSKGNAYNLENMATDAIAILDHLEISKVHVIGMSMGGMIGQRLAISYTDRVKTLTSIMSTGYWSDPQLVSLPFKFKMNFIRAFLLYNRGLHKAEVKIKFNVAIYQMLLGKGNYKFDPKSLAQTIMYEIKHRRAFNPKVGDQHSLAIVKSGSRYEELKKLQVPTLVIHGTDDTLIKVHHAKKYAPMIPNAKLVLLDGMGHDLPEAYMNEIHEQVLAHIK